jgi:uncharacterized protein YdbL (DUF1318 family)
MRWVLAAAALFAATACVTINVYFPEAAAEKAAARFVDEVLGEPQATPTPTPPPPPPQSPRGAWLWNVLSPVGSAYAQADLEVDAPAVKAIQGRMAGRFRSALQAHFASGALGFTRDGKVAVRDAAAIPLAQRAAVNQAVADENRDRDAVYREIAVANGHPEWEADIRAAFAKQWAEQAGSGWYYQDASGAWKQKM